MSEWWLAIGEPDQARFLLTIENRCVRGGPSTLLAFQGHLEPLLHTALAQREHGSRGAGESLRGLCVAPVRSVRIDLQQHIGVLDLVCRRLVYGDTS